MITQDAALQIAYAERPDMLLRAAEFASNYALADKPALIVQASPEDRNAGFHLTEAMTKAPLLHGANRQVAWWDGFNSSQAAQPVFRGWALRDAREAPQWSLEMHRDGSCIAGVWAFPESRVESADHCLHDFYTGFFEDFIEIALRLTGEAAPTYRLTASLLHANRLPFVMGNGGWARTTPAPRLSMLQWPLRVVSQPDAWRAAGIAMCVELFGAYGHIYRPESR